MVADERAWQPLSVLCHNLVELVSLVDTTRHRPRAVRAQRAAAHVSRRDAGRALDRAERIVCVSRLLADRTTRRLPQRLRARVSWVNNGVDCELFRPVRRGRRSDSACCRRPHGPDKGAASCWRRSRLGRRDVSVSVVGSAGFAADAR